jgi:organic radical activating enzyme
MRMRKVAGGDQGVEGRIQTEACEINVVHHCNLACRSCSHASPALRRHLADPDVVRRDLAALAPHYRPEHVRLVGGEPLLHPALAEVIAAVRSSGITDRIRMITNGTHLGRMTPDVWAGIDELHVSLYPGHLVDADDRRRWDLRAREYGVAVEWKQFDYFRESYSEIGTDDAALVRRIYRTCQIAHVWRCHNVIDGHFYLCPQSYFVPALAGDEGGRGGDGLWISERPSLGLELRALLARETPLRACRNCLGSVGRRFPHRQVARAAFRSAQARPTEELLDREFLERLSNVDPGASNGCVTLHERS